ncbi:hypothetical protein HW130_30615 [Streptomyces sp. PKU-EA00015]|uniref:hypothetical protein n=1 Tax=Streptomyces sp. PKU-EA00015 TaxID=2748326 RepID=UPI0015A21BAF|nr:hypothetical protein [Streptomyces sp. PKU-EA00015]NWF30558.1 hypothetical protein [Streptomyces sp. PKU-EA00015]
MDAGLAAIVAGGVGAAGAAAAAWAGGWWTSRSASEQLRFQDKQARRQQVFEHAKERRATRQTAYTALIAASQKLVEQIRQRDEDVQSTCSEIDNLATRVSLEGPVSLLGPLEQLRRSSRLYELTGVSRAARSHLETEDRSQAIEQRTQAARSFEKALWAFTDAARQALDDSGTEATTEDGE